MAQNREQTVKEFALSKFIFSHLFAILAFGNKSPLSVDTEHCSWNTNSDNCSQDQFELWFLLTGTFHIFCQVKGQYPILQTGLYM